MIELETKEQWKQLNRRYANDKRNWFDLILIALRIKPRLAHPDWKNIAVIGETKPDQDAETELVEMDAQGKYQAPDFGIVRSVRDWDALNGRWTWPKHNP